MPGDVGPDRVSWIGSQTGLRMPGQCQLIKRYARATADHSRRKSSFWRPKTPTFGPAEVALGTNNYFLCEVERWYVVHTLPLREQSVQRYLENQQYRTFLPRYIKTVRHARRLKTIVASL